ncbi:hypothetical protein [Phascolarctobacterium succinatutens]|uniref:hypothetical protein n=1 Tax=Phascolarctobacterium succinatutens TaxID=626940 RepID=UPI0026F0448B|nr:hypothetical protein [Phascolarctobacterium succinatutens]
MICLDFAVSGLMLKKKQYTYLVAGTKNCISIKVKLDRHWQDLEVFAVCYRDNKEYPYAITNGECLIADMAVISTSGEFKLKLLGSTADGNVVMTTNVVTVYINDNKFSGAEGGELEYPTSDYLAEVLAGSKQAAEQAKHSADAAGESAKQAKLSAEQVNRDAMQVANDKKSVTELTGQAVKAAGNAQTYMEQTGQIKADTQTITDSALQAMGKLITKAQADINAQGTEIITQATAQADRAQSAADGIRDTADTLQGDNEHLKAELKHANRRISVLYDLGKGITHRYEMNSETSYSKDVPSGAKVMDVKMVGGKSVVGNHLVQDVKFETRIGDYADRIWKNWGGMNVDVNDGVATFKAEGNWYGLIQDVHVLEKHKYYFGCDVKSDIPNNTILAPYTPNTVFNEDTFKLTSDQWTHSSKIDVAKKTADDCSIGVRAAGSTTVIGATISCKNIQCIDLTQMFGAGNEPTLEQFEAMLTRPDYPYNAGTFVSADVTDVQVGDKVISLPNSISLKSAGSVYDSLEFYEQDGKYYQRHTQRVGVVDLGTLTWNLNGDIDAEHWQWITLDVVDRSKNPNGICNKYIVTQETRTPYSLTLRTYKTNNVYAIVANLPTNDSGEMKKLFQGAVLYYELATPIVTVTEIDNRFDAVDVSTGDKITFVGNSDYHLPVPNEEEYLIALNEVTP